MVSRWVVLPFSCDNTCRQWQFFVSEPAQGQVDGREVVDSKDSQAAVGVCKHPVA